MLNSGNDNSKAVIPVGGAIASFLTGELEYGVNGALPESAVVHGRVSQDGVSISPSATTTTIYGWPYADAVATLITDSTTTFSFTFLQVQEDKNLEVWFGSEKNAETGGYHLNPAVQTLKRSWVIDAYDKTNNVATRWYFPSANVTERGESVINGQGLLQFSLTFTAYATEVEGVSTVGVFWTGPLSEVVS